MSLKKMLLSGAAALALISTAASAADVKVAQDGTGDYLLAPVYYAIGDWKTTLKVVNTNPNRAIVAKVVVRDGAVCNEIMDFLLYLTPGDVWEGTLFAQNGKIVLNSTDDSMVLAGTPASEVSGGYTIDNNHPVPTEKAGNCTMKNFEGYVEIVGLVSYDPAQIDPTWTVNTPLDKKIFYSKVLNGSSLVDGYDAQDVSNDDLMGKVTISRDVADVNGKRTMMINMLALENMRESAYVGAQTIGVTTNTKWAQVSDKGTVGLMQYDAAIAKERVYVMYEGDGQNVNPVRTNLTIPTKKYWFDDIGVMPSAYQGGGTCATSYYYSLNPSGSEVTFRDMQENVHQCHKTSEVSGKEAESCEIRVHEEVYHIDFDDKNGDLGQYTFASGGYVDMSLANNNYTYATDTDSLSFHGMPVVPTTFYANKVGDIYLNNWLYNQYKDANAQVTPVVQ